MEDWVKAFLSSMERQTAAIDRQTSALRENTQELNEIKIEAKLQTASLEEMKKKIGNDEVVEKLEQADDKLDTISNEMKVQWAIVGGGFLSVIVTIIAAIYK
jgi:hypothetical protein